MQISANNIKRRYYHNEQLKQYTVSHEQGIVGYIKGWGEHITFVVEDNVVTYKIFEKRHE